MPKRRRRRGRTAGMINIYPSDNLDKNERYVLRCMCKYLEVFQKRYKMATQEALEACNWALGPDIEWLCEQFSQSLDVEVREVFEKELKDCRLDSDEYPEALSRFLSRTDRQSYRRFNHLLIKSLKRRSKSLAYKGTSEIEKNVASMAKVFGLDDIEKDFLIFLYIVAICSEAETFFVDELKCNWFSKRHYLATMLQVTRAQVDQVFRGKMARLEMFDSDTHCFGLEEEYRQLFENKSGELAPSLLFSKLTGPTLPLENHLVEDSEVNHILGILKAGTISASHILLYGPPGTGKTSFAKAVAKRTKLKTYEIRQSTENKSGLRRAAIEGCLNMTDSTDDALIIIDEADNLLNTRNSWFERGETQDKGWINKLLEKPGVRMIWITNRIRSVEDSVLRRFSHSLHFQPFNTKQRIQVWDTTLRRYKAKRMFSKSEIENLADRYEVSAGAVELAVRKAVEMKAKKGDEFMKAVSLPLDAYQERMEGMKPKRKEMLEKSYSLEGLNLDGNANEVISQLEAFDRFLLNPNDEQILNMTLLFYGPPGTGKSELARFIARHLDRRLIVRRASDILSKWVGEAEENIAAAFTKAERDGAVLVMDEADSFIFPRAMAKRSWEISQTNEFLTQMERFKGILICTTNRFKDLDQASIRRFSHKIGFHFLEADGNVSFYKKMLQPLTHRHLNKTDFNILKRIEKLAPGDFKTVRNRFAFRPADEIRNSDLIKALEQEVSIKKIHNKNKIGF